jgi:hypothetical protein
MGSRCRSLPTRTMVRARFTRQSLEDAIHVLAILRWASRREHTFLLICVNYGLKNELYVQCLGQEFALNQASYFIVRLLQRFNTFTLAPDFMPAGSLPPAHWAGMPGRQGVEKIHPAINFTMHSKVRVRWSSHAPSLLFYLSSCFG